MKKILLATEDVPTKLELQHAVSQLMKCHDLLKRIKGKNNTEDPRSMLAVACFLDMLIKREARNLRKEAYISDAYIISLGDMFVTHLMSIDKDKAIKEINSLKDRIDGGDISNI
jgi:hypothetical protein